MGIISHIFENILRLDRFELIAKLNLFLINVNDSEETEKMRNLLRKVVLEEILKNKQPLHNLPSSLLYSSTSCSVVVATNKNDTVDSSPVLPPAMGLVLEGGSAVSIPGVAFVEEDVLRRGCIVERLFVAREMVVQEEGRNVEQIMGVRQVENKTEIIRRLRQ